MAEKEIAAAGLLAEATANCCNGRVGRRMLELAEKSEVLRAVIAPTGVELIRQAAQLGRAVGDACNCCNGRVGSSMNLQELARDFGGQTE